MWVGGVVLRAVGRLRSCPFVESVLVSSSISCARPSKPFGFMRLRLRAERVDRFPRDDRPLEMRADRLCDDRDICEELAVLTLYPPSFTYSLLKNTYTGMLAGESARTAL